MKEIQEGILVKGDIQFTAGRLILLPAETKKFVRTKKSIMPNSQLDSLKPSLVNKIYLEKIITLAKENHIQLFYILMPSPNDSFSAIGQREITYLNYTFKNHLLIDTSRYNDGYFRDSNGHLNVNGIKRFETFLNNDIYGNNSSLNKKESKND